MRAFFRFGILDRYLLRNFLSVLVLCLLAATSLFLVFEAFEKMNVLLREDAGADLILQFLALKVPLIVHLMTPVAVLVATLISIGRLSQSSELTAMRACGMSVFALVRPLLVAGAFISVLMFILGETLVPWATDRVDEIYNFDIKKKHLTDTYDKADFWYRVGNKFYNVGLYDSRKAVLRGLSIFEFDQNFRFSRRTDAKEADWNENPLIGWTMKDAVEIGPTPDGAFTVNFYPKLPLVVEETPKDFINIKRRPESMSYFDLKDFTERRKREGVSVTPHLIDLASKVSFPLVNLLVILIAFPFALIPARSGTLTASFVAGVSIGFGYHVIHAICTSLGSAELLPIIPAAWAANILTALLGGYLLTGAEYR